MKESGSRLGFPLPEHRDTAVFSERELRDLATRKIHETGQ